VPKSDEPSSTEVVEKRPDAKPRPQKPTVPYLDTILKTAFDPDISFVFSAAHLSENDRDFLDQMPPLWDPDGANKRREMRKQAETLQKEQEEVAEPILQTSSSVEVEAEEIAELEGGSAQLGGDAEERPDRPFGLGHHPAIQPPPQHGFGNPAFGHDQNLDLGGISIPRTITPQDHRHQLLQQLKNVTNAHGSDHIRGHGRTGSRFNFATDSSSGTTATSKPMGGANVMKQQPLMGQGGQFGALGQHQPLVSQFYSSGVQGPPPGLKTTGTPPVSGGGMFGQGHGFTPGVSYGATARENEKFWEYPQRGPARGPQVPDAGKRELMFSYQQHHPSTSSSPAPGLLNFPYGQPGGFSESGSSKQKKKGKKHRHANTSSSGGGGPVDVADPSILQARLHQNGMPGQGLYGGQGQGGFSLYGNTYSRGW
jgi:CCR4-NOT transcription complex subunit 4